jgi:hypothetical protein
VIRRHRKTRRVNQACNIAFAGFMHSLQARTADGESNAWEAVQNNALGVIVAKSAIEYGVKKFVLISTNRQGL